MWKIKVWKKWSYIITKISSTSKIPEFQNDSQLIIIANMDRGAKLKQVFLP